MSTSQHHRLAIIGSGPAGWTAALYAARAGLKPVVIVGPQPGGQLTITTDVENYPGFPEAVTGPELMEKMRAQAERFGAIVIEDMVERVDFASKLKELVLADQGRLTAEAVIIATGAKAKWLGAPGEQEFMGRGVSGCATCDGFFFRGLDVAVVGGGNVAVEEAIHLAGLARHVTLIHRRDTLRCEKILADRLMALPNVSFRWNSAVERVVGDDSGLTGVELIGSVATKDQLRWDERHEGGIRKIEIQRVAPTEFISLNGLFVAIGHEPATSFLKGVVDLLPSGHVKVAAGSVETSVPGVFAAGDVMDPVWRQAVTSAGFGCMAALAAERYLHAHP